MDSGVLDLVYTDICDPFPTASWNGHRYVITFKTIILVMGTYTWFIRNLNQCTCLKSIKLKLKINRIEILKPLDLTIVVSTMTDTTDQVDFQNLLSIFWKCDVVYTMPGTLHQNDITERWNHITKDMIRSMITHTTLPKSL